MPQNRITLIARADAKPDADWNHTRAQANRLAFVNSMAALRCTLGAAIDHVGLDIERLIADRAGTAEDYLMLLAAIPSSFTGDVVLIRDDGSGFLSATGRGGDRVLYPLGAADIRFYLETHDLVTGRIALQLSA